MFTVSIIKPAMETAFCGIFAVPDFNDYMLFTLPIRTVLSDLSTLEIMS